MNKIYGAAAGELLNNIHESDANAEPLAQGATLLRGFARLESKALMEALDHIVAVAPFRHMITPSGHQMSASMTNCGEVGWVTDRSGYRYEAFDPTTSRPWPPMPSAFFSLANRAAAACRFPSFAPDACLINRYEPSARLSLHQDRNEQDFGKPIVSVSLGLPVVFLFGGLRRSDRPHRVRLESGDVVVWGGPARLAFHGVSPLADGDDPLTGRCRINLTFRKAGLPE